MKGNLEGMENLETRATEEGKGDRALEEKAIGDKRGDKEEGK